MATVGASPWGLPYPRELVWRLGSQGRLGCPKSGHNVPGDTMGDLGVAMDVPVGWN